MRLRAEFIALLVCLTAVSSAAARLAPPAPPAEPVTLAYHLTVSPTKGDSTQAIQKRIDALEATGGTLEFGPGTYFVSVQCQKVQITNGFPNAINVHSRIRLFARPGVRAIIRLRPNTCTSTCSPVTPPAPQPLPNTPCINLQTVFGFIPDDKSPTLSDFVIDGLTIDAQPANAAPQNDLAFQTMGFATYIGQKIRIINTRFRHFTSQYVLHINGPSVSDIIIAKNRFSELGLSGPASDNFDTSALYFDGQRMRIEGNVIAARFVAGTLPADVYPLFVRTGIEVHGSDFAITHNRIKGFQTGIIVAADETTHTSPTSFLGGSRQIYAFNIIEDAAQGIAIWNCDRDPPVPDSTPPEQAMSDILIHRNVIKVGRRAWGQFVYAGDPTFGIGNSRSFGFCSIAGLNISDNSISIKRDFAEPIGQGGPGDAGVFLSSSRYRGIQLTRVRIVNNTIEGTPADGAVNWRPDIAFGPVPPVCQGNILADHPVACPSTAPLGVNAQQSTLRHNLTSAQ